jgi:hypothetical protein
MASREPCGIEKNLENLESATQKKNLNLKLFLIKVLKKGNKNCSLAHMKKTKHEHRKAFIAFSFNNFWGICSDE